MIRGEIIMSKINLLRTPQKYTSYFNMGNNFSKLEKKLYDFLQVLQQEIDDIKKHKDIENRAEYLEEIKDIERKIIIILDRIIKNLKTKDIKDVQYVRLNKIIDHHILTSKNFFQSKKTPTYYVVLLNYLSEVPCYLEIDLGLESIPGIKPRKIKLNKRDDIVIVRRYTLRNKSA